MITLKESQLLHRAHLNVIAKHQEYRLAINAGGKRDYQHFYDAVKKAEDRWMALLTRLTPPPKK